MRPPRETGGSNAGWQQQGQTRGSCFSAATSSSSTSRQHARRRQALLTCRTCPRACTRITSAARLLLSKKIHRLPVVDSSGKLVGVLSRGNLVKAALAVRQAATPNN